MGAASKVVDTENACEIHERTCNGRDRNPVDDHYVVACNAA